MYRKQKRKCASPTTIITNVFSENSVVTLFHSGNAFAAMKIILRKYFSNTTLQ